MNKPLIFTAALMSAALVAGAAVDAEKNLQQAFPGNSNCRVPPGGKTWRYALGHLRGNRNRQRRPTETGLAGKER